MLQLFSRLSAATPVRLVRSRWTTSQRSRRSVAHLLTFTYVKRGGAGLEIETPYYQIDVRMPGVW